MDSKSTFRPWHYLRNNHGCTTPANCLFFDSETIAIPIDDKPEQSIHQLRLWDAISVRYDKGKVTRYREHSGETREQFWAVVHGLMDKRKTLYAFSHNSTFDLTELGLWRELEAGNLKTYLELSPENGVNRRKENGLFKGLIVLNSPPFIFECMRESDSSKVIFLDTLNYFRSSLENLGNELGEQKLKMPAFEEDDYKWHIYCRQDCRIIFKAIDSLMRLIRENDMGNFRYTASSQAMTLYRHKFNKHGILIHGCEEACKLEREAYFGGECRVFQRVKCVPKNEYWKMQVDRKHNATMPLRESPVYILDCQSFYPFIMSYKNYPRKLIAVESGLTVRDLYALIDKYLVCARIKLDSPEVTFPYRLKGQSIMSRGLFDTTLCTPELKIALANDCVRFVGHVSIYEQAELFTEYMSYCHTKRKDAVADIKPEIALFWKLMANSLFGKFGQRSFEWESVANVYVPKPWGHWTQFDIANNVHRSFRSIAWLAQEEQEKGEYKDSFPAISAHVTSYGREYMRKLRTIARIENVLYQDTDSLHVLEEGYENLRNGNYIMEGALGRLRLQYKANEAEYFAPKHYWLDGNPIVAGIKKGSKYVGNETWQQEEWQGIGSILQQAPPDGITTKLIEIDRSRDRVPGAILQDGTVEPFYLTEW